MLVRLVFAIALLSSALAQAIVLPAVGTAAILPNLVLVSLLVWSALRGVAEGLVWVFGIGLVLDLVGLDTLGVNGLALLPVALLAGIARRRFFQSVMILPILLTMLATLVFALMLAGLRGFGEGGAMLPTATLIRAMSLQALLNAILVPPIYLLTVWTNRWLAERR